MSNPPLNTDRKRLGDLAATMKERSTDFRAAACSVAFMLDGCEERSPEKRLAFAKRVAHSLLDRTRIGVRQADDDIADELIVEFVNVLMLAGMDLASSFDKGGHA